MSEAVVLLSGGLDSAACLALAAKTHERREAVFFNYGQRSLDAERSAARYLASVTRTSLVELELHGAFQPCLLTDPLSDKLECVGRNTVFQTVAATRLQTGGHVYVGTLPDDRYPDSKASHLYDLSTSLSACFGRPIRIYAPFISRSAQSALRTLFALGGRDWVPHTTSCSVGGLEQHDWGVGCGRCKTCELRIRKLREHSFSSTD